MPPSYFSSSSNAFRDFHRDPRHQSYTNLPMQSGHKPGKHGKPGKLREIEKLLKSQGKSFIFAEKPGKLMKNARYVT